MLGNGFNKKVHKLRLRLLNHLVLCRRQERSSTGCCILDSGTGVDF
jgi:hypothetical protein